MATIQELEAQKNAKLGQQLIELAGEAANNSDGKKTFIRLQIDLRVMGDALIAGEITYAEIYAKMHKLHDQFLEKYPSTTSHWGYREDVEDFGKKLCKLTQDFSTPKEDVGKRYKAGTMGHGILQALAFRGGCRAMELKAFYPTLNDSSTLTHMRRDGLIEKSDAAATSPFILTDLGRELLQERGIYTVDMYPSPNYNRHGARIPLKQLPWELSEAKYATFVRKMTNSERFSC